MYPSGMGLLGGTFDPIHQGHIRLARALRDELALATVRLIPAGWPYHRQTAPQASPAQRLAMVKLAIEKESYLMIDEREIKRQSMTYTVDTLMEIRREVGPNERLWFLMGDDTFTQLITWKNWLHIFSLTNIAIAKRNDACGHLPDELQAIWQKRQVQRYSHAPAGEIYCLGLPCQAISSSTIRDQLAQGHFDETLPLPKAVLSYIRTEKLYSVFL